MITYKKRSLQDFVLGDNMMKLSRKEGAKPHSTFVLALVGLASVFPSSPLEFWILVHLDPALLPHFCSWP